MSSLSVLTASLVYVASISYSLKLSIRPFQTNTNAVAHRRCPRRHRRPRQGRQRGVPQDWQRRSPTCVRYVILAIFKVCIAKTNNVQVSLVSPRKFLLAAPRRRLQQASIVGTQTKSLEMRLQGQSSRQIDHVCSFKLNPYLVLLGRSAVVIVMPLCVSILLVLSPSSC
jgi:hypothetical protein